MPTPDLMTRVGKLIPLLGSDKSGEVSAAGSAITRALKGAGLDWHDINRWILAGQSTAASEFRKQERPRYEQKPPPENTRQKAQREAREARDRADREATGGYQQRSGRAYNSDQTTDGPPPNWQPSYSAPEWQDLARRCLARDIAYLNSASLDFLRNQRDWGVPPSWKQEKWMKDICRKQGITF